MSNSTSESARNQAGQAAENGRPAFADRPANWPAGDAWQYTSGAAKGEAVADPPPETATPGTGSGGQAKGTILDWALTLNGYDYWSHLIHPNPPEWKPGDKSQKRPIGKDWGKDRWDDYRLRSTFKRYPRAGVGIALGPGRAPGGGWLIDLEGDGPEASDSLITLLGGEIPDTPSWGSFRGGHWLFFALGDVLLDCLAAAGAKEGTGIKAGVWKLPELPGLEFRIGGRKPDGTVKQVQSVCPPTIGDDGKPRAWNVLPNVPLATLPEAAYAFLESIAERKAIQGEAAGPDANGEAPNGHAANGDGFPTSTARGKGKLKARATARDDAISAYAAKALADECDAVEHEPEGNRNARLNEAAFCVGQIVGAKALMRSEVEPALLDAALKSGLERGESVATIRSGLDAGILQPRDLSHVGNGRQYPPSRGGSDNGAGGGGGGNGQPQAGVDPLNLTEWGNAKRLVAAHGKRLRYCKPLGLWLEWDGTRWRPDQTGAIWRWAKETVRALGHEAANTADDKHRRAVLLWALKSEEKKVMGAMIELAWSEPGISIMPDELDREPWLLNTPTGTIDLKTGELRPHRQEDLITKITSVPFDPKADCPKWKKTLREIFADDDAMVAYVQRALGYSLTGVIREHALFLCHGTGRNGKNTVLDTVATILSDYATIANPRTFLTAGQNDHLAMVADLMGRRFVPTDEVDEGEQLAESMVKRLTGNKMLKARFMHKNPFEFPVLFKVWMLANSKPEIQGQDEGIWSRIRLIPFEVYFPPEKRIKGLGDILLAKEGPGILKWLVDGCLEWQRIGLAEPDKVLNAVKEYRSEQNVLMDFLGQCVKSYLDNETLREQAKEKFGILYGRYVSWCKDNGEKKILTSRKFGLKLTPLGYKPHESNGVSYRLGLNLKDNDNKPSGDSTDEDKR